jgi:hypothetical protein
MSDFRFSEKFNFHQGSYSRPEPSIHHKLGVGKSRVIGRLSENHVSCSFPLARWSIQAFLLLSPTSSRVDPRLNLNNSFDPYLSIPSRRPSNLKPVQSIFHQQRANCSLDLGQTHSDLSNYNFYHSLEDIEWIVLCAFIYHEFHQRRSESLVIGKE